MANNAQFFRSIKAYINKAAAEGEKDTRRVGLAGLKGVMVKTPVDKGTARANWNVAIDSIDRSTSSESSGQAKKSIDPAKFNEGSKTIQTVKPGQTINISNSMPYINKLEYTNHSQQGSGMVRRTIEELRNWLKGRKRTV
jgi:hypothetical protein